MRDASQNSYRRTLRYGIIRAQSAGRSPGQEVAQRGDRIVRIVVVGTAGAGKTTLARTIAATLAIPHIELDALHWDPGWNPLSATDPNEFVRRVASATAGDAWVADGNYGLVRELAWGRATHLVWLDYDRPIIMARVIRRTVARAVFRTKLWSGNVERWRHLLLTKLADPLGLDHLAPAPRGLRGAARPKRAGPPDRASHPPAAGRQKGIAGPCPGRGHGARGVTTPHATGLGRPPVGRPPWDAPRRDAPRGRPRWGPERRRLARPTRPDVETAAPCASYARRHSGAAARTPKEIQMQYMLLIYNDEVAMGHATPAQMSETMGAFTAYTAALRESRALVAANRLDFASTATTVRKPTARPRCSTVPTPRPRNSLAASTSSRCRISTRPFPGQSAARGQASARSRCGRSRRCMIPAAIRNNGRHDALLAGSPHPLGNPAPDINRRKFRRERRRGQDFYRLVRPCAVCNVADHTPRAVGGAVEAAARRSYGKLLAFLAARTRDLAGAEDALSEASRALAAWPVQGVPRAPEAWLLAVARRKAIDARRRRLVTGRGHGPLRMIAEAAGRPMLIGVRTAAAPDVRLRASGDGPGVRAR